ncbi:hypothetical protein HK102_013012, partial [Quaeritorhiza haematococci]
NGQFDVVRYLLEKGADAEAKDSSNNTPLHYASAYGWMEVVRLLVEWGEVDVNATNDWKTSAVMVANSKAHIKIVNYFLNEQATDVNFRDNEGATLLHHCVSEIITSPHDIPLLLQKVRLLLNRPHNRGADPTIENIAGHTPLHLLATEKEEQWGTDYYNDVNGNEAWYNPTKRVRGVVGFEAFVELNLELVGMMLGH